MDIPPLDNKKSVTEAQFYSERFSLLAKMLLSVADVNIIVKKNKVKEKLISVSLCLLTLLISPYFVLSSF